MKTFDKINAAQKEFVALNEKQEKIYQNLLTELDLVLESNHKEKLNEEQKDWLWDFVCGNWEEHKDFAEFQEQMNVKKLLDNL